MYLCAMMQEALLDKKRRRRAAKNGSEEAEEDDNDRAERYNRNRKFMTIKDSLCMSYVLRCLLVSMCSMRVSV